MGSWWYGHLYWFHYLLHFDLSETIKFARYLPISWALQVTSESCPLPMKYSSLFPCYCGLFTRVNVQCFSLMMFSSHQIPAPATSLQNAMHHTLQYLLIFFKLLPKNVYYLKCSSHRLSGSEAGGGFVELRVSKLALDPENNNQARGVACAQNWHKYAKQHLPSKK